MCEKRCTADGAETGLVDLELTEAQVGELLRRLDRSIRWHSFLNYSNLFSHEIAIELYRPQVVETSYHMSCRQKVMDNIKSYKKRVLERVEACSVNPAHRIPDSDRILGSRQESGPCRAITARSDKSSHASQVFCGQVQCNKLFILLVLHGTLC